MWKSGLLSPDAGKEFYWGVTPIVEGWKGAILGVWQRWDAIHYIRIAQNGYTEDELSVFFPLYPWLGRLLLPLTGGDALISLLIISSLTLYIAMVWLYRITAELYSKPLAFRTVLILISFPAAFFLFAPFAESLPLMLTLLAYDYARRSRWLFTSVAGFAAGLTHPTVIPLTLALAWEAWQSFRKQSPTPKPLLRFIPLLVSLTPLMGTGLFLAWRISQGFTSYTDLQFNVWSRRILWPWQTLLALPELFQSKFFFVSGWINILILLVTLMMTLYGIKRLPVSMIIYQVSLTLFLLSTTLETEPLASLGRHSLLIFPLLIELALWAQTNKQRLWLFSLEVSLQLYMAGLFFLWIWVS